MKTQLTVPKNHLRRLLYNERFKAIKTKITVTSSDKMAFSKVGIVVIDISVLYISYYRHLEIELQRRSHDLIQVRINFTHSSISHINICLILKTLKTVVTKDKTKKNLEKKELFFQKLQA